MVSNGNIYQGQHEPMITVEEFDRVQWVLGRRGKPRPKKRSFVFTGLIRCKECGCLITAEEKVNRYGYHYIYYHCTKKKTHVNCTQASIRLEELERQILDYLYRITISDRFVEWALKYLRKINEKEEDTRREIKKSLEKAYKQNQSHLDKLIKMRYRDLLSDEEFLKQKRELLREQAIVTEKIASPGDFEECLESAERFFLFLNRVRKRFEDGYLETKRGILKAVGSNFYLKDKKLFIEAKRPFLIIEEGLKVLAPENLGLEPPGNGSLRPRFDLSLSQIRLWWAQVENVRTFFLENRDFEVPDLWE